MNNKEFQEEIIVIVKGLIQTIQEAGFDYKFTEEDEVRGHTHIKVAKKLKNLKTKVDKLGLNVSS